MFEVERYDIDLEESLLLTYTDAVQSELLVRYVGHLRHADARHLACENRSRAAEHSYRTSLFEGSIES